MADQLNLNAQSSYKNPPKYSFAGRPEAKDKKKGMPGPGQYPQTSTEKDKFGASAKWGFGGTQRDDGRIWANYPGPGHYKAGMDPRYQTPQRWSFGSEPRLHAPKKKAQGPGPGHYDVRGNLEGGQSSSIASRPEGKAMLNKTPGPGQYKADSGYAATTQSTPSISFGGGTRGELVFSKTPGPGQYELPTTLCGNMQCKIPPKYSIKGRYSNPGSDKTPGPPAAATTFK